MTVPASPQCGGGVITGAVGGTSLTVTGASLGPGLQNWLPAGASVVVVENLPAFTYRYGTTFTILADRDREGPWGLFGGDPGQPAAYVLNPDAEARRLPCKTTIELQSGDVVSYRTCGGGGYGPPEEREPERVLRDVLEEKVSAERAREVYRVVVSGRALDEAATAELRGS